MDNPLVQLLIGSTAPPKPIPVNASIQLRYELWLRDNHKWLLPMLDTARSLTLFLPGRFQEGGQLSSEAIYTALNVVSVYHDYLLDNPRALTAEIKLDPQGKTHSALKVAQGVLLFLHYTEVFFEMAGKKYFKGAQEGDQTRGSWMCIAAVEAIKAYCRLSMLYVNRGRMLTPPSQEEIVLDHMASIRAKQKVDILSREKHEWEEGKRKQLTSGGAGAQPSLLPPGSDLEIGAVSPSPATASASSSSSSSSTPHPDALPPNSSFALTARYPGHLAPLAIQNLLDLYVQAGRAQSGEQSRLGRPHGRFILAQKHAHEEEQYRPPVQHIVSEILHILRPVLYTLARSAYASTPDEWSPFLMSLAVDGASRALAPKMASLSKAEHDEVSLRIRNYLFYLLRDPLFSRVLAEPLMKFAGFLGRIPLVGAFLGSMIHLVFSIQKYYFYTSAS
jgi:hypothetical protein